MDKKLAIQWNGHTMESASVTVTSVKLPTTTHGKPSIILESAYTTDSTYVESGNDVFNGTRSFSRTSDVHTDAAQSIPNIKSFIVLNIQGLKPRSVPSTLLCIQGLLKTDNQLFIALTETWLREHKDLCEG